MRTFSRMLKVCSTGTWIVGAIILHRLKGSEGVRRQGKTRRREEVSKIGYYSGRVVTAWDVDGSVVE